MQKPLTALQQSFPWSGKEGLLITSAVHRKYLLSLSSSAGTLLVLPEQSYLLIDFRYYERAKGLDGVQVILQNNLAEQLNTLCNQHDLQSLIVEEDEMTLREMAQWQKKLSVACVAKDLSVHLQQMRQIKSQEELSCIAKAQTITDEAFARLVAQWDVSRTERQIAAWLEYTMRTLGAQGIAFDTIVAAGRNSSMPHAEPSDYVPQPGDLVTIDFGAKVQGYCSDMTRTVAIGQVSDKKRAVYDTVRKAQQTALDGMRHGMTGHEIDRLARDVIDTAGYVGCFGHSLGHSLGLEIHESPTFAPKNQDRMTEGMVMTVEPGIYLEGEFGVRIEDLVVFGHKNIENLTKSAKNLICLGISS